MKDLKTFMDERFTQQGGREKPLSEAKSIPMDTDDRAHMHVCMLMRENNELRTKLEDERRDKAAKELSSMMGNIQLWLAKKYNLDLDRVRLKLNAENSTIEYVPLDHPSLEETHVGTDD